MTRLCLLIPYLASIAAADPLLFSDVDIIANISADNTRSPTSHRGTLPLGDPTKIEVFGDIPLWGKFTIDRTNPHSRSFMSAMGMTNLDMGVGVSGLRFVGGDQNASPFASVLYEWTVTNNHTTAIPIGIEYRIPQMELWIARFSAFAHAYGEARLEATQYLADGSELASWKPFSYWASLYYLRHNGGSGIEESEAIQASLSYRLLTYVYASAEAGGQPFVGDPFSITGDGPPVEVFIGTSPNSEVPDPATAGLAAAAQRRHSPPQEAAGPRSQA